jgi:hypothetical protein
MPRYFFHLKSDGQTVEDDEGVELQDLSAARAEALAVVRDLLTPSQSDHPARWLGSTIEVADEAGQPLLQLPITA